MSTVKQTTRMQLLSYRIYRRLIAWIRTSDALHFYLMGYRPCQGSKVWGAYWDWTTLALTKAMRMHLQPSDSFLDMGTGSVGVLALYAGLRLRCEGITAVDFMPDLVSMAQENAQSAKLAVRFVCSDLFCNVEGTHDVIVFNAPYLDEIKGHRLGLLDDPINVRRFSGGETGGKTIARFLEQAPSHLSSRGRVLLGVNHFHITPETMLDLIASSRFFERGRISRSWLPGTVYVLVLGNEATGGENDRS